MNWRYGSFDWSDAEGPYATTSDNKAEILDFEAHLEECLSQAKVGDHKASSSLSMNHTLESEAVQRREEELCRYCALLRREISTVLATPSLDTLPAFKHLSDYNKLRKSARTCPICSLIYKTLLKNSNFKLFERMMRNYSDTSFNQGQNFYSDGISDYEGSDFKRVEFRLIITALDSVRLGYAYIGLRLKFSAGLRTPKAAGCVDIYELLVLSTTTAHSSANFRIPTDSRLEQNGKFNLIRYLLLKDPVSERPAGDLPGFYRKFDDRAQHWLSSTRNRLWRELGHTTIEGPARLLQIFEDQVRLVNLHDVLQDSQATSISDITYVALSHRWGEIQHCTTTKHRLNQHHSGLNISDLPQTFRDAIIVTKHLGITYLWIDALCILQDCVEDWAVESLKMGDIFHGAQVVLAAHCAGDDSEGFLRKALCKREAVQLVASKAVIVCLRANFDADVTRSQLSRRGWVVQERFLASQTIHFTDGQIYWETPFETRSECGITATLDKKTAANRHHLMTYFSPSAAPELSYLLNPQHPLQQAPLQEGQTSLEWLDLVEMYSNCDLTQEDDKLIAISGIAKVIQRTSGVSYCAGIWADLLCHGLLWLPQTETLTRLTCSRASSWSWAAVDGPVQYPDDVRQDDFFPAARLIALNNEAVMDGEQSFRWLNGAGPLTLEVDIMPFRALRATLGKDPFTLGPGPRRAKDPIRNAGLMTLQEYVTVRSINYYGWIALDMESSGGVPDPEKLVCAKIATRKDIIFTLFLETVNSRDSTYRRVGIGPIREEGLFSLIFSLPKFKWERLMIDII